jgi:hypothetical protein
VAIEKGIDSMSANTSTPMMSAPSSGQANGSGSALTAPHPVMKATLPATLSMVWPFWNGASL